MNEDWDDFFDLVDKLMNSRFSGGISRSYYTPSKQREKKEEEKKIIDITEDDEHIYATIQLTGVRDDDLNVIPNEDSLSIEFKIDGIWYRRTFPLPNKIDPITSQISYKNFILDVVLDKVKV